MGVLTNTPALGIVQRFHVREDSSGLRFDLC